MNFYLVMKDLLENFFELLIIMENGKMYDYVVLWIFGSVNYWIEFKSW